MSASIFQGDLPRAVDPRSASAIPLTKKGDYISFEPVRKSSDGNEDPSQADGVASDDLFDEFEQTLGDKIAEPVNAEVEVDEEELAEKLENAEVDDEATEASVPINELFESEFIVDFLHDLRTPAYMGIFEWRAEKKKLDAYFRYLSGLQNRTDDQQKEWVELDAWLKDFDLRHKELEGKVAWSEKHRQKLVRYLNVELAKLGDKRVPIWLYILGVEVIGLGRVGMKDTKRDGLSFELPESIPSTNYKKAA